MKIIICVKRDIEGCIALNYVLEKIPTPEYRVILSDKFTPTERRIKESADFIFYERDLLVDHVFPLIEKQAVAPTDPPTWLTFNRLRKSRGIPIEISDDINSEKWQKQISDFAPDAILSIRNDFIFKKNIITLPKHGIFNIHPGSLPAYRGVYAPFRAMYNGDKTAGCTLHMVDEGIDTGPLIGIKSMEIDYSKSVLWHMCQLYPLGIDLFIDTVRLIEAGEKLEAFPQDESTHRYYSFPTSEEFRNFSERGNKLIDNGEYLALLKSFQP